MANEDLLLRQMPHSLEGEQAVLGSMLIDADCVKDVMDKLRPSDFYLRQNREIFETIYSMFTYAKPIDGITVCEEMQKAGTYDENTTRSYLAQLMEITPTSANVMEYAAIVRDKALLRGVAQAATILNKVDIRIDDNPMLSVADMNAKCRRLDDLGLVVIDYLQLMTSAGGKGYAGENRQQVVSDISRMLKIMAKELNVPVICLSQLSRASEKRDDKRPMLSDLRESGAIEQDADIVLFLYRDDYYNEDSEKHNIAECIVAKNRHGETGKVELRWMPEYTQFSTLDTRYDED